MVNLFILLYLITKKSKMEELENLNHENLREPTADKPVLMTMKIILSYIVSDISKKPRSFRIGMFTIYLVVMFLSLV